MVLCRECRSANRASCWAVQRILDISSRPDTMPPHVQNDPSFRRFIADLLQGVYGEARRKGCTNIPNNPTTPRS